MLFQRVNLLFVIVIFATTVACTDDSQLSSTPSNMPYFDLKGLLEQQVDMLDSLDPEVQIEALIGNEHDEEVMQKDSADWAETLALYVEADLNKPVLRDQYLIRDSLLTGTGKRLKIYQAKQPQEVDIPYMKIYYEEDLSQVRRVETLFRENNPLYSTQRQMELRFANEGGTLRLLSFGVTGKQKMILRDSILYQTVANLRY